VERIRFARWELSCDPAATRAAYDALEPDVVRSCECHHCRNYRMVAEKAYPAPFLDLLAGLGIDPRKEAKVENSGVRPDDGMHIFDGWYSFVGRIETGGEVAIGGGLRDPEGPVSLENYEHEFELVGSDLAIGFSGSAEYIVPTLGFAAPVAHLLFAALVPWVIDYDDDCDHFHRFFEK
jgi:hypothetical protein